jgi:hypothetical protein
MKSEKLILLALFVLSGVFSANADIRYVKQGGAGSLDGSSWDNASDDLQAMITASASSGDMIFVAAGTYTPASGAAFTIGAKTLGIYGGFVGNENTVTPPAIPDTTNNKTILQGNGNRVIDASNGTANLTISGFRIQGGNSSGTGGGINLRNGVISYCSVVYNTTTNQHGGGIFMTNGTLKNSIIAYNNAGSGNGGGIRVDASGEVVDCIIKNNTTTGPGGGIKLRVNGTGASILMKGCTVENNSGGEGGGIHAEGNGTLPVTVENCIISSNTSSANGGGIVVSKALLINSLVVGNNTTGASQKGGGIRIDGGSSGGVTALVYNCTVVNNATVTGNTGGGVSNRSASTGELRNTIVWDNTANSITNDCENNNGAFYCLYSGAPASDGNISSDPQFVNAGNGDYRLSSTSPAIDVGDNTVVVNYLNDLVGSTRIFNSIVDMGAYEYNTSNGVSSARTVQPPVWTSGNTLFVQSCQADELRVYSASGLLYSRQNVLNGQTIINTLPAGVYIVKLGNRSYRVIVR